MRLSAAAFSTATPVSARSRERDHGNVRVLDEPLPDIAAATVDDIHDAPRDTGLDEQFDKALAERGRVGRRLEDDRVAADERGRDLPRGNRDREVPRRDHANHADGHPYAHVELVAKLRRRRLAEEPPPLAGHVEAHVDRFLHVSAGFRKHLPHLTRHQERELVLVLTDEGAEAVEHLAAGGRRHEAPLLVGLAGGGDGPVDVVRARAWEGPDQLARRRRAALERSRRRRRPPTRRR